MWIGYCFFSRQSTECKLRIGDKFVYRRIHPHFFVDYVTFTVEIFQPTVSLGWCIPSTTWDRTRVWLFCILQSITTHNSVIRFFLSSFIDTSRWFHFFGFWAGMFFRLPNTFLERSFCSFINSAKNCLSDWGMIQSVVTLSCFKIWIIYNFWALSRDASYDRCYE